MDGQKRKLDAEQNKAVRVKRALKSSSSKSLFVYSSSSSAFGSIQPASKSTGVVSLQSAADSSSTVHVLHPHVRTSSMSGMARVHSEIAKIEKKSRASMFPWSPRKRSSDRESTRSPKRPYDPSPPKGHYTMDASHDDEVLFLFDHVRTPSEQTDLGRLAKYFLGFWKPPHAATALSHLDKLETKRTVRALQQRHGCWTPPPEVMEVLRKSPLPSNDSHLPDNKDGRDLKFILKVLGCSLRENKPYKQFLRAKTLRQKRKWLYKYQGPHHKQDPAYMEPVCLVRLKRLYQFFPNRFTEEDGFIYFNNKMLMHDEATKLFYIGTICDD